METVLDRRVLSAMLIEALWPVLGEEMPWKCLVVAVPDTLVVPTPVTLAL